MKNIEYISIARGIAIIAMVFGHTYPNPLAVEAVSQFHMPLFFLCAGFCFKSEYCNAFMPFLKRRVRGILFPLWGWSFLFIIFHNFFYDIGILSRVPSLLGEVVRPLGIGDVMVRILDLFLCFRPHTQLLGGYWFLPALFWASLFGYWIVRMLVNCKIEIWVGVLVGLVLVSGVVGHIPLFSKWWMHFEMIYGGAFFVLGVLFRKVGWKWLKSHRFMYMICAVLFCCGLMFWPSYFQAARGLLSPLYFFTAASGCVFVLLASEHLANRGAITCFLTYAGNHSLSILTWHFLSFKLVSVALIPCGYCSFEDYGQFPVIQVARSHWWMSACYLIVGVGVPLLMYFLYSKILERVRR